MAGTPAPILRSKSSISPIRSSATSSQSSAATIDAGPEIRWRRDYLRGIETGLPYFRRIPYLDTPRAGDHKVIWELNRHQHLIVLAQAYRLTGDTRNLDEIRAQLESWIAGQSFSSRNELGERARSGVSRFVLDLGL